MSSDKRCTSPVFEPEERLLALLSFVSPNTDEEAETLELAGRVRSWESFLDLARQNATEPLVWQNLCRTGLDGKLPAAVRQSFIERRKEIEQANQSRLAFARKLFTRFAEQRIPVVILKGVLFAETIYADPCYKKMNDVDILIKAADLDRIYDLYATLGMFSAAELIGGKPRKQEKFSHHAPPFFSPDLRCMVGTHWGLVTPLAPYKLDYDRIWSRVEEISFYESPALAMSPIDNLHHLCVHLPYYKTGVRELADIYNLVQRHRRTLDWALFFEEVQRAKTNPLVYYALTLANRLRHFPEIDELLHSLRPSVSQRIQREAQRRTRSLAVLLRSRSVHPSRVEKAFGDLNATKDAKEKREAFIHMWRELLIVPSDDAARMASDLEATTTSRLAAPLRLYRNFARDVGPGMFWLIMAKCAVDVVKTSATGLVQRQAAGTQAGYARIAETLGVTVDDLKRLKDSLE